MKKNVEKWANDPQYSKIKFYQSIVDDIPSKWRYLKILIL